MQSNTMKRILIVRIDFLGDMVCTTAFIRALKQRWPEAEIHVVANRYNGAVLDGNPDVHAVHFYVYSKQCERNGKPGKARAFVDRFLLMRRLRRLRFDLAIVPNGGMNKSAVRLAKRVGAAQWRAHDSRSEFDDRNPEHVAHRPMIHEALAGFQLMPELPRPALDDLQLHVHCNPALRTRWAATLGPAARPRVGLFVCNKAVQRRWSNAKWRLLAERLNDDAEVIAFCDPTDRQSTDALAGAPLRCICPPSVPELIAAMSLFDLVVTADSAPVHIASALRLPVVALFERRPEKYLRWHPLGTRYVVLHEGPCVDDIDVDPVCDAVRRLLALSVGS